MAYMKHLPFYNRFKIVFEFLYTFLAVFQFAIKSESLNDCYVRLAGALYQSRWYNCSPEVRKTLCILLRNFQDSRHFFLLRGIVKVAFTFLLRMVKVAFSFINFVKLRGQL
uniref:Odorant receptor 33 n=1 Tax=Diaphorina citri TaxID=121845 RepID=A0A7T3R168_DIACI|nr:odorant receptor 33 [Diaphorina citri]